MHYLMIAGLAASALLNLYLIADKIATVFSTTERLERVESTIEQWINDQKRMTSRRTAATLRVSRRTLSRMREQGAIAGQKDGNGHWYYTPADIREALTK